LAVANSATGRSIQSGRVVEKRANTEHSGPHVAGQTVVARPSHDTTSPAGESRVNVD
jgi:hypothetical protein